MPCNVETGVDAELMRRRAILDNTHREGWDSERLAQWDYEPEELEEMGVEWKAEEETFGYAEGVDYSAKNQEVDVDALESSMTLSLKYTADEYWQIKEQLSKIAATPEQAVWKLLGNE